jgi:uncharacterized protein YgiM (DUF1202 family)
MPDQRTSENWRLEEGGQEDDKWLLQESEQQLSDQWQLQEPPLDPINSWQPVEYVKPPRPAGTWILPTIITIALLVTLGYAGYRVLPALLNGETDPTPTGEASAVVPGVETTAPAEEAPAEQMTPVEAVAPTTAQESAPTATLPPPTPTTPSNMVTQEFATVNSPFGVNARFSPDTDAAVIRILENGENLFVFSQQGEWLELFVADTPLTEGEPLSGTVGYAATEFFTMSTQEITQGLRDQVLGYAGKLPTPTPEPTVAVVAPPPSGTTVVTETGATTPTASILTVTINSVNGVNVRRLPATDDTNIIRLLENGTVLPAVGRSADNQWIQVTLPDAVNGWIAADFLMPSADITTLPVTDGSAAAPVVTPSGSATPGAAPVGATGVVTSGAVPPPPYTNVVPADSSPAIIVTVVDGVNARKSPTLDGDVETVVPQGAVLPATGRSADGQWVQVQLPTGVSAWIFRDTVNATPAVGALPAVGGPTPEPVLLPTPTPTPGGEAAAPTTAPTAAATATTETTTVTAQVIPFFLPVYSGPDNQSETVARSPRGTNFVVVGRSADGSWLQVTTDEGVTGWVVAGNVRVTGDVSGVPVVE